MKSNMNNGLNKIVLNHIRRKTRMTYKPKDLNRDVLKMCSSFHFIFLRWIVTSSELVMKYVSLIVQV